MSTFTRSRRRNNFTLDHLLLSILSGFILFFIASAILFFGFQFWYIGKIYPNVSVAGMDVSGLRTSQAAILISSEFIYPREGRIILTDGEQNWLLSPADLGLMIDPEASAQHAYQLGRNRNPVQVLNDLFSIWYYGYNVSPVFIYNENIASSYLSNLATTLNQPLVEPSIRIQETNVLVQEGQPGRILDIPASLALISTQLQKHQDGVIPLVLIESQPTILDVESQAQLASSILSQPLQLNVDDQFSSSAGPWSIPTNDLARMLAFEIQNVDEQNRFVLTIKSQTLRRYLGGLSNQLYKEADNTRFIFNDDTRLLEIIQPAVIGHQLNIDASIEKIQSHLINNDHSVTLVLETIYPRVTDEMTGQELGIRELVHAENTYFYGSTTDRIQNIQKSASEFHGLLVAPGEVFSMASAMGDISLDNGYAEALIIYGGRTIQGVGGGVCQVSTTLFRTAFFGGFPILERHPHSYRVGYYERVAGGGRQDSLAGLDATVYVPVVDFKFKNDTPHWLLMETYVNPSYSSITWKFYSTDDGRTVDWRTSGLTNVVPAPKTVYIENQELAKGETRRVDWKADGAEITVNRTVYLNGNVHLQDTIYTKYQPWAEVIEYGPGTDGYPPENDED